MRITERGITVKDVCRLLLASLFTLVLVHPGSAAAPKAKAPEELGHLFGDFNELEEMVDHGQWKEARTEQLHIFKGYREMVPMLKKVAPAKTVDDLEIRIAGMTQALEKQDGERFEELLHETIIALFEVQVYFSFPEAPVFLFVTGNLEASAEALEAGHWEEVVDNLEEVEHAEAYLKTALEAKGVSAGSFMAAAKRSVAAATALEKSDGKGDIAGLKTEVASLLKTAKGWSAR